MTKCGISERSVDDFLFRMFLEKMIVLRASASILQSRKTRTDVILTTLCDSVISESTMLVESVRDPVVSFTTDAWTSFSSLHKYVGLCAFLFSACCRYAHSFPLALVNRYIDLTVHFFDNQMQYHSYLYGIYEYDVSHTGLAIWKLLEFVIQQGYLQNVRAFSCCTDNGSNAVNVRLAVQWSRSSVCCCSPIVRLPGGWLVMTLHCAQTILFSLPST